MEEEDKISSSLLVVLEEVVSSGAVDVRTVVLLPSNTPEGEEESNMLLRLSVLSTVEDVLSNVAGGKVALLNDSVDSTLLLLGIVLDTSLLVGRVSGDLVVDSSFAVDDSTVLLVVVSEDDDEVSVDTDELSSDDDDADEEEDEDGVASDDDSVLSLDFDVELVSSASDRLIVEVGLITEEVVSRSSVELLVVVGLSLDDVSLLRVIELLLEEEDEVDTSLSGVGDVLDNTLLDDDEEVEEDDLLLLLLLLEELVSGFEEEEEDLDEVVEGAASDASFLELEGADEELVD